MRIPMNELTQLKEEAPTQKACWELIGRVAESSQLRRSARLQNLLLYIGRRSLREGSDEIHEQEIGVEVFGRPAGYDTNVDNIVRVNASELRKRLGTYFESEGSHEALLLHIPRGKYVPVFRYRNVELPVEEAANTLIEPAVIAPTPPAALAIEAPAVEKPVERKQSRNGFTTATLAGALILFLAIGCATLWVENHNLRRAAHPWSFDPLLSGVWSSFLDGSRDTDVVMEDSSFLLVQNINQKTFSFDEYLGRSYLNSQMDPKLSPMLRIIQEDIAGKTLARAAEVRLIQKILLLDPGGKNLHIYNAREYMPGLLAKDNLILLGNPTSNPWFDLFQDHLNFRQQPNSQTESSISNHSPAGHEQAMYTPTEDVAYGVVAYLPKPEQNGNMLLIEGTSSEATEACGNFILSNEHLSTLEKLLHTARFPYFELLLKVSHVRGTPITTTIEAYRTYPSLK